MERCYEANSSCPCRARSHVNEDPSAWALHARTLKHVSEAAATYKDAGDEPPMIVIKVFLGYPGDASNEILMI